MLKFIFFLRIIFPVSIPLSILWIETPAGVLSINDQKFGWAPRLKGRYDKCILKIGFFNFFIIFSLIIFLKPKDKIKLLCWNIFSGGIFW